MLILFYYIILLLLFRRLQKCCGRKVNQNSNNLKSSHKTFLISLDYYAFWHNEQRGRKSLKIYSGSFQAGVNNREGVRNVLPRHHFPSGRLIQMYAHYFNKSDCPIFCFYREVTHVKLLLCDFFTLQDRFFLCY